MVDVKKVTSTFWFTRAGGFSEMFRPQNDLPINSGFYLNGNSYTLGFDNYTIINDEFQALTTIRVNRFGTEYVVYGFRVPYTRRYLVKFAMGLSGSFYYLDTPTYPVYTTNELVIGGIGIEIYDVNNASVLPINRNLQTVSSEPPRIIQIQGRSVDFSTRHYNIGYTEAYFDLFAGDFVTASFSVQCFRPQSGTYYLFLGAPNSLSYAPSVWGTLTEITDL